MRGPRSFPHLQFLIQSVPPPQISSFEGPGNSQQGAQSYQQAVMLIEAKLLRTRPRTKPRGRGQGRGQFFL